MGFEECTNIDQGIIVTSRDQSFYFVDGISLFKVPNLVGTLMEFFFILEVIALFLVIGESNEKE